MYTAMCESRARVPPVGYSQKAQSTMIYIRRVIKCSFTSEARASEIEQSYTRHKYT